MFKGLGFKGLGLYGLGFKGLGLRDLGFRFCAKPQVFASIYDLTARNFKPSS